MKVDGGLSFVVGPMGAGKTLFEVRGGVDMMLRGGWWITNVPLYPDALDRIARHVAPFNWRARRRLRAKLERRYIFEEELDRALRYGVAKNVRRPGQARARLGWDESYSALNAREWDGGRGKTKDDRAELLENVPMLRKLGVAGYLLAQHEETVDKNMRRICNWTIRLQNQRENVRILGKRVPMLPPLFLAYYYQSNAGQKAMGVQKAQHVERHFLTWHRNLYDTLGLYNAAMAAEAGGEIVWLGGAEWERAASSASPPLPPAPGLRLLPPVDELVPELPA